MLTFIVPKNIRKEVYSIIKGIQSDKRIDELANGISKECIGSLELTEWVEDFNKFIKDLESIRDEVTKSATVASFDEE